MERKLNTNDQQMRLEAATIANSNAQQGTPTELILAEAEKIVEYLRDGISGSTTELAETVRRVIKIRQLRLEHENAKEERRIKKEQDILNAEIVDEEKAVIEDTDAVSISDIEKLRSDAIDAGVPDDADAPDFAGPAAKGLKLERDPEFQRLLAEEEEIERQTNPAIDERVVSENNLAQDTEYRRQDALEELAEREEAKTNRDLEAERSAVVASSPEERLLENVEFRDVAVRTDGGGLPGTSIKEVTRDDS